MPTIQEVRLLMYVHCILQVCENQGVSLLGIHNECFMYVFECVAFFSRLNFNEFLATLAKKVHRAAVYEKNNKRKYTTIQKKMRKNAINHKK